MSKSFPILESLFSRNYWVRCFRWYQTGLGVNLNLPISFFGWSLPFCPSLLLVSWKVVPYILDPISLISILYPRPHCLQTIPFTAVYLPPPPLPGLLMGTLRCHGGDENDNDNVKKAKLLDWIGKTTPLHVQHAFQYISFNYRHCTTTTGKCLISRFMEDVNKRRLTVFFIFLNLNMALRNSAQKEFACIWPSKCRVGVIAIEIERTQIHFLSNVFVAVTVVVS